MVHSDDRSMLFVWFIHLHVWYFLPFPCVSLPKLGLTDPYWSFLVATLGEVPCASKVCQDVRPGRGLTTT